MNETMQACSVRSDLNQWKQRAERAAACGVLLVVGAAILAACGDAPGGTRSAMRSVSSTEYNDDNPAIIYSLTNTGPVWNQVSDPGDFNSDEHTTNVFSSSFTVNFRGTDFQWIGRTGPNFGIATVYLDGRAVDSVDNYSQDPMYQQVLYTFSGLSDAPHVFQAAIGEYPDPPRNPLSSDTYQSIDGFITSGTPLVLPQVAAWGGGVSRSDGWTCGLDNPGDLSGGHCWSDVPGQSMSITFTGTGIEVYGRPDGENGKTDVILDGTPLFTYDGFSRPYDEECFDCVDGQNIITLTNLSPTSHTLTLVVSSQDPNPASQDNFTQIDEFMIIP